MPKISLSLRCYTLRTARLFFCAALSCAGLSCAGLSLVVLSPSVAHAGTITPGLARLMATKTDSDVIRVLVVLPDQLDVKTLDKELRFSKASKGVRHEAVVGGLQDLARASQSELLKHLALNKSNQGLQGFKSHWLINAVVVSGTVAAIKELAERPDVDRIEADLVAELIEPTASWGPSKEASGFGVSAGVVAIGARRVWNELGIDGTGTLVGLLDSGADGNHPALSARWQGNFSPVSQTWLDAAQRGHESFPEDTIGHGTHVLSIVIGAADGDTVGVAPGAHWIASNAIVALPSVFDNAIITALEFMTDPDGDPSTSDDVPDVLQNSWGVNSGLGPYLGCDSRWWDAIDNCEAAGVVLVWAAGNEGPVGGTLRSPADRASSPYNCFSVGSTSNHEPYTVSAFSSQGPSRCGGVYAIKPEITAPGDTVLGAAVGGGYFFSNGTSMAAPHVAGVVALMRQANPDVDVVTIKDILMQTAVDLGNAGEDNVYGHGFLNAYDAVLAVMSGVGTVSGVVTDAASNEVITGALVKRTNGENQDLTDDGGNFSLTLYSGQTNFTVSAFSYFDGLLNVDIPDGGAINENLALDPEPTAIVTGLVNDPDGLPLAGATVLVQDVPIAPVITDANGAYEVVVPIGQNQSYSLRASAPGFGALAQTVSVTENQALDFQLPVLALEDFESGGFFAFPWQFSGDSGWQIESSNPYEGDYCARSGAIFNSQTSELSIDYFVETIGDLSFWYLVSAEATYDFLNFYIDGQLQQSWTGETGWSFYSVEVLPGMHNFLWEYSKDDIVAAGADAVFLDEITLPTLGVQQFPAIAFSELSVFEPVAQDLAFDYNVMISNVGGEPLNLTIASVPIAKVGKAAVARSVSGLEKSRRGLPKGEKDSHPFEVIEPLSAPTKDLLNYSYTDSDDLQGPQYEWLDISSVGLELTTGDDLTLGPFDLGFPMTFYGDIWQSVYVSTNGFLSFSSTGSPYVNPILPDSVAPNNIVAPFWDDLNSGAGGGIFYWADPESDRFVVQFEAVRRYGSSASETFQVVLKSDGSLTCHYKDVSETGFCTVGIENEAGDDGLTVLHNSPGYLRNNFSLRFEPPGFLPWLKFSPLAASVEPGGEVELSLEMNSFGLAAGNYVALLAVTSDDPDNQQQLLSVSLQVTASSGEPEQVLPANVVLFGASPNPFNPRTEIRFQLPAEVLVSLRIYDVKGRLVRELLNEVKGAGDHSVSWNGLDDNSRPLASGTYYSRLVGGGASQVKAMALVR
ncbi:MAG: subtilisin family serine protease [Candidatus Krumholzibacteriia bacterium]|jgi:subtilisin family serine protease